VHFIRPYQTGQTHSADWYFSRAMHFAELGVQHVHNCSQICKQPPSSPAKKFKAKPLIRKIMEIVFWKCKLVLFVGFLNRGDTVTAEHYCDTLKRLRQASNRKRPV
jgi:hypothetical protein